MLDKLNTSALADFLLKLYCAAQEKSSAQFPEFAIAELKKFVDFDMALFGLIQPAPLDFTGIHCSWTHVHQEPTNMIEEWFSICSEDAVLKNMISDVGRARSYHVPTAFNKKEDAAILDFALRTRHINLIAVATKYSAHDLSGAFSIRRAETNWKFESEDNALTQMLAPHLWEAIRINRAVMESKVARISGEYVKGVCICDDKGLIVFQDISFERLCQSVFRGSDIYRIPKTLNVAFLAQRLTEFEEGRMQFTCRAVANLRFITATIPSNMDRLSARETEVARFFGTGLTHSEIADELNLSSSTVRRHIEAVYKKLNINNKADLAFMVHTSNSASIENLLAALEETTR